MPQLEQEQLEPQLPAKVVSVRSRYSTTIVVEDILIFPRKWGSGGVHTARGARASAFSLHGDGVDELVDCGLVVG